MELEEKDEEFLETLWIRAEEKREESLSLDDLGVTEKGPLGQLLKAGYVSLSDDQIRLTAKGRPEARNVVRRHRLAERLLADVLGSGGVFIHEKACKFEHLLDRGLDESICTLLVILRSAPMAARYHREGAASRNKLRRKNLFPLFRNCLRDKEVG